MQCKRQGCYNTVKLSHMTYCSRDCSPYGYFSLEKRELSQVLVDRRKKRSDFLKTKLKEMSDEGKTIEEACAAVSLAVGTAKVYCRGWKISFKKRKSGMVR